jgi:hypothetical protein
VYLFHPTNVPGEVEYIGTKNINPPRETKNPILAHKEMNLKSMYASKLKENINFVSNLSANWIILNLPHHAAYFLVADMKKNENPRVWTD